MVLFGTNVRRVSHACAALQGAYVFSGSALEYDRALAYQIGEQGRGVHTIVEMVHHTRLDTAIAPAGLMRAALVEAHHWVSHRSAFQKNLIDQPLMRTVLADLTLDWEGSLASACCQRSDGNPWRHGLH